MPGGETRAGLERLSSDPEVARIDIDRGGHATDAESLPLIGGDVAHSEGLSGKGVTIAVLDSGIDATHPDLASSLVTEHCVVIPNGCPSGGSEQDGPGSARDDNGHGTNIAGIIAADGKVAPIGVAPDVSVVAVRVLDGSGRFETSAQVVSALNWIALNHPYVRVINMSFVDQPALLWNVRRGNEGHTRFRLGSRDASGARCHRRRALGEQRFRDFDGCPGLRFGRDRCRSGLRQFSRSGPPSQRLH